MNYDEINNLDEEISGNKQRDSRAAYYAALAYSNTMRILCSSLTEPQWYTLETPSPSERPNDLAALDAALARLQEHGLEQTPSYERLQAKREALAAGFPYRRIRFDPSGVIGALGGQIATLNRNPKGQRIPARTKSRARKRQDHGAN